MVIIYSFIYLFVAIFKQAGQAHGNLLLLLLIFFFLSPTVIHSAVIITMGGSYYLSYYYLLYLLIIYLMCRVILELEELQESQVPPVKWYVSSDDKKGISCSYSPHQIVSFIWLEQLNGICF